LIKNLSKLKQKVKGNKTGIGWQTMEQIAQQR